MSEPNTQDAEIEITEALCRHARLLSQTKDPRKKIAAARWELKLDDELRRLRSSNGLEAPHPNGKEDPAHA